MTEEELTALESRLRDAHVHSQQRVLGSHIFGEAADAILDQERGEG